MSMDIIKVLIKLYANKRPNRSNNINRLKWGLTYIILILWEPNLVTP